MFRLFLPILGIALLVWAFKKYKKHSAYLKASSEVEVVEEKLEVQRVNEKLAEKKSKLK